MEGVPSAEDSTVKICRNHHHTLKALGFILVPCFTTDLLLNLLSYLDVSHTKEANNSSTFQVQVTTTRVSQTVHQHTDIW